MPRKPRGQEFLFEPARFVNDLAVMAMSLEARGAYITLLCALWDLDEPGVVPADDRVLARLAGCTGPEWERVRGQVAGAFDTYGRPGSWVQRGLVRTHAQQSRRVARLKAAGRLGASVRWDKAVDGQANATAIAYKEPGTRNQVQHTASSLREEAQIDPVQPEQTDPPPVPSTRLEEPPHRRPIGFVQDLAAHLGRRPPAFPNDAMWTWITSTLEVAPRDAMQIAAWLWKDGEHDVDVIKQLVTEIVEKRPKNVYAYLAKDGPARTCRHDQVVISKAEHDHNAAKQREREELKP